MAPIGEMEPGCAKKYKNYSKTRSHPVPSHAWLRYFASYTVSWPLAYLTAHQIKINGTYCCRSISYQVHKYVQVPGTTSYEHSIHLVLLYWVFLFWYTSRHGWYKLKLGEVSLLFSLRAYPRLLMIYLQQLGYRLPGYLVYRKLRQYQWAQTGLIKRVSTHRRC